MNFYFVLTTRKASAVRDGWNEHWIIKQARVHTEGQWFPQPVLRI